MLGAIVLIFLGFVVWAVLDHRERQQLDRLYYDDPEGRRQVELERKQEARKLGVIFSVIALGVVVALVILVFRGSPSP